ncbi:hypothetical protein ACQP00_44565 [Dactylosporangium sp. CS-047395]|uniref:hypothetical protein n=1 Tax=Dactylosporangium sp. CS-047395 TaxID=3239936 RepID=UPI003D93F569
MNVSWDARVTDLPLPGRSIVDGRPGVVIAAEADGPPWRRRPVPVTLTAEQARAFRRYEQARRWGYPVAIGAALVGVATLLLMLTLPSIAIAAVPLVLFAPIMAAAVKSRRPAQFPRVVRGRVTLAGVDRVAAYEWLCVAGDRVAVTVS